MASTKQNNWKSRRKSWRREHPQSYSLVSFVNLEPPVRYAHFPCPLMVGHATTSDPKYYSTGRLRPTDSSAAFHYTLGGGGVFSCQGRRYDIHAGQGVLFRGNDPQITYYYPKEAREPWEFIWINFLGVAAHVMMNELIRQHGHVYSVPRNHFLIQWMLNISQKQNRHQPGNALQGARLITDLIIDLGNLALDKEKEEKPGKQLVHRAIEMLSADDSVSWEGASMLARRLGVSREHLSRTFRQEMDISLQQFVEDWRVRRACHLLKETTLTIKEISAKVGYTVPHSFIHAFKRQKRKTPRAYRLE